MHFCNLLLCLILAGLASLVRPSKATIAILTPASNTIWYKNNTVQTTWSSGPDDPATFRITILQLDGNPVTLADTVPTSLQALTLLLPQLADGEGYQIRYINATGGSQVFAESQPFEIAQGSVAASATATASVSTTAAIPGPYTPFPSAPNSGMKIAQKWPAMGVAIVLAILVTALT